MGNKVDLQHLKAALVLALDSTPAEPKVAWWSGVVKDEAGEQMIVAQVPNDLRIKACKALLGYGIKSIKPVVGSSHSLLPIDVDYLENCLPSRVTRKWAEEGDASDHHEWKREVTAKLDERHVTHLKMEFSGAGDSSNDDEWQCSRNGGDQWYPKEWSSDAGKHWYAAQAHELADDLKDIIATYVWETLVQVDCVNNDGGGGCLEIDLTADEPEFLFSVHTNEMVTHDHEIETSI